MPLPLPTWVIELINGWLALMLPWVIWTAVRYLTRRYKESDHLWEFYRFNKMAFALLVFFTGLEIRTSVGWITRHAGLHFTPDDHPIFAPAMTWSVPLFLLGGTMMVVGAVCWARVASDMPLRRPSIWIATISSFLFSLWFAVWSPW